MRTEDRLQPEDIRIIKALYGHKKNSDGKIGYNADNYDIHAILKETGLSEEQARPSLANLRDFDFIEWDGDKVKLLPSGIKYSLGQFDHLQ